MAITIDLQMFAEVGTGTASAGADGADTGVQADSPSAQGVNAESPTAQGTEDKQALYSKFKGEFKEFYDADVSSAVQNRLKKSKAENKALQGKVDSWSPIIEQIASKYGVAADDLEGLQKAFEADDKMYEDEAYEKGMTVEQVKQFHKLERENAQMRAEQERAEREAMFAEWDRQFAELQQIYPNAEPSAELQNENFTRLMNAGVPIRDAYELVHKDELTRGAMQFTANRVAEKMTNAAITNNAHPTETGLNSQAAAVGRMNMANLSLEELQKLANRARAGERIDLKN